MTASITRTTPRSCPISSARCVGLPTRSARLSRPTPSTRCASTSTRIPKARTASTDTRSTTSASTERCCEHGSRGTNRPSASPTMVEQGPMGDRDELVEWRAFLNGLGAVGAHIASDAFPGPPIDRDEGFRQLGQQVLCWLGWSLAHGDPTTPIFQRQNDLVTMWGGPNADNVYRHARVDPGCTYRIRGKMRSCEQFALAIRPGFRHTDTPATLYA